MNDIITVEKLTENLDEGDPLDHGKIMKRIKIASRELQPYATWSKQDYTRNCVARTEQYEIILLCWDIGAKTPIHDHGGENCWVYQVQGTVEERRFKQDGEHLKATKQMVLTPGKLTYMNDRMGYHSIENISNQRAMTLHIYASPIDNCKVYNNEKDCFEIKEMSYHSFKGLEEEICV
jgi:cysteine dioxygenase